MQWGILVNFKSGVTMGNDLVSNQIYIVIHEFDGNIEMLKFTNIIPQCILHHTAVTYRKV